MRHASLLGLSALAMVALGNPGCGKPGGGGGQAGAPAAGRSGAGGAPGSGGAFASGGTGGGFGATGGAPGSGGRAAAGGSTGASGGAPGNGGMLANGGALGNGGAPGSGGTKTAVDAALGGTMAAGGRSATGGTGLSSGGVGGGGGATAAGGAGGGTGGTTRASGGAAGAATTGTVDGGVASGRWSMGYYASWNPDQYPISEIEWSGLTHIAMAFYLPQSNASLKLAGGDDSLATNLIAAAHANGVKAVASIGGSDSQASFQQATASAMVATFASNLVALLDLGYDGIDIDWEPMDTTDEPAVIDIANRVRKARPTALLTIPIGEINVNIPPDLSGYADLAAAYDQLNIMSYGQAGIWSGWKSWHSSALYQTDSATPTSIDSTVKLYTLTANVPAAKLGIGIGFYGLCYTSPVTGPDQALGSSTLAASDGTMSYANIMTKYYDASARKWDDLAKVPYLSFSSPHAPDNCTYISYDDEQSIAEKGAYLKAKGLGGVIQWELNEAYLSAAAAGQRNPLLKAIHDNILE